MLIEIWLFQSPWGKCNHISPLWGNFSCSHQKLTTIGNKKLWNCLQSWRKRLAGGGRQGGGGVQAGGRRWALLQHHLQVPGHPTNTIFCWEIFCWETFCEKYLAEKYFAEKYFLRNIQFSLQVCTLSRWGRPSCEGEQEDIVARREPTERWVKEVKVELAEVKVAEEVVSSTT